MPEFPSSITRIFKASSIDIDSLRPSSTNSNVYSDPPSSSSYFVKSTSTSAPQLIAESASLQAMYITTPALVPRLIGIHLSTDDGQAGMVSEYFDLSSARSPEIQRELGMRLAEMHRVPPGVTEGYTGKYGFGVPTFCGVTEQDNTWEEDWGVFFRDRRLGDLVGRIGDEQIGEEWEVMQKRVIPKLLFGFTPKPEPVILHGDLWSGNVGFDKKSGEPKAFDPSSYWGHNEADLGITYMFGGFSKDFYTAYHAIHPKSEPYYEERQELYELYHHLNHTLMFGGGYKSGALRIMRKLTSWAEHVGHAAAHP